MWTSARSARGVILMAVYHADPGLLRQQIESLKCQTVASWDCVVGVDGSNQAEAEFVESLVSDDRRFTVTAYPDNVGVYRHFERLLYRVPVSATWFALADQDDHWYPDKLELLLGELWDPRCFAVSGQARVSSSEGEELGVTRRRSGSIEQLLLKNQVTGSLTLFRRDVIDVAVPFPDGGGAAMHDHWLGVCAAALGKVKVLDWKVQDYVQHGGNVLGEVPRTRIRDVFPGCRPRRTWLALDSFTSTRWEFRAQMAAAIGSRSRQESPVLSAIARGDLTAPLLRALFVAVVSRRLRPLASLGMLLGCWRWRAIAERTFR